MVLMVALETHSAIEAVWRIESAKIVAGLARMTRDVGLAEELAQDALVAALERWPTSGVPVNPGAWLMTTAKHRAIDRLRRARLVERKHEEIGHGITTDHDITPALEAALDGDPGEDALRLGRILAALAPSEPEVHGLVALMEIQASRMPARLGPSGEPILLLDQNRARWDRMLIRRGLAAIARAEALGGARGSYALQA